MRPIFNEKVIEKNICESREQYMGPTSMTHFDSKFGVQIGSRSCALCTGPTGKSVSPVHVLIN